MRITRAGLSGSMPVGCVRQPQGEDCAPCADLPIPPGAPYLLYRSLWNATRGARWWPPAQAAQLIGTRMGARARPFANHNLDIARSRNHEAAIAHWEGVLAELRRMSGLVPAEE